METQGISTALQVSSSSIIRKDYDLSLLRCWRSLLVDSLPKLVTITDSYYCALIPKLRKAFIAQRRAKLTKGILFHQDNAQPYRALVSMTVIHKAGFELLEHPPYSLDLALRDYRLFAKLKEYLRGKKSRTRSDVLCRRVVCWSRTNILSAGNWNVGVSIA